MSRAGLLLLALALAPSAQAQARKNVLETLSEALALDRAYDAAERGRIVEALRARFADYGLQIVDERRRPAIPVVLHVITEGSFDSAPPERMAEVAFAAYQAMGRGAPADVVEGIALYGYRKSIPGERIALWANGYRQLVESKVPGPVAADLVRLAMERDIPDSDFNTLKWSLVDGVKEGYDAKDYATYLFGNLLQGKSGPGRIASDAKSAFRVAKRSKKPVSLPSYEGVFSPKPPPPPVYEAPVQPIAESVPAPKAPSLPTERPAPRSPSVAKPAPQPSPAPSKPAVNAVPPALQAIWPSLEAEARSYLGTPYVWGGTSRAGIDCSALMQNSYGEVRVRLPRVSRDQWKSGVKAEDSDLREGDLVFFNTLGAGVSHVALVVDAKAGKFIHASSSKGVSYADLNGKYYKQRYLGARRVVQ